VLQDLVNEIGLRLGFTLTPGPYRGTTNAIGFDGLWTSSNQSIVVEIKTSSHYNIDIDRVATYRKRLIEEKRIEDTNSSILIVVGRFDTGGWESQIRGSRHAWDTRLLSIDALLKLLKTKEAVDDPSVFARIISILTPHELTRLDAIIDLVFSTAREAELTGDGDETQPIIDGALPTKPVSFYEPCLSRLTSELSTSFVKEARTRYISVDGNTVVQLSLSKEHRQGNSHSYWFAYHPHQRTRLLEAQSAYLALGCGSEALIYLIPVKDIEPWLEQFWTTVYEDGKMYWHIRINRTASGDQLATQAGNAPINISKYRLQ
jgi:hypothetical protein